MAVGISEPKRFILQEYGSPLRLRLTQRQVEAIVALSSYWKSVLGLSGSPLSIEAVDEGDYCLRANGITGVVRIDDFDIEIAPKFVDIADGRWKGVLWRILLHTYGGFLDQHLTSADSANKMVLSDLMGQIFLRSFNQAKSKGLPQKYTVSYTSGYVLGGSIDYSRLEKWVVEPWSIPFIADLLSQDATLASLLGWAAMRLSCTVMNPQMSKALRLASNELIAHISRVPSLEEARKIKLGPQYRALQGALTVSLLLLESKGAMYGEGHELLSGFLWNSDVVYENFLFSICARAASRNGLVVSKTTHRFGRVIEGEGSSLVTIPDVVFSTKDGEVFAIADSKYKIFSKRPKSSDTYQILAAGHILGSRHLALMYPTSSTIERTTWEIDSGLEKGQLTISALPLNLLALSDSFDTDSLVAVIDSWLQMKASS